MMKIYCLVVVFFVIQYSVAQEHIQNGTFDTFSACPTGQGQINKVVGWNKVSATPDFYHTCYYQLRYGRENLSGVDVPYNINGFQYPHIGKGYIGCFFILKKRKGEEVQTKLMYPLKKEQTYYVEFFVNLANSSDRATSSIGVYFCKDNKDINSYSFKYKPYVENPVENIITDTAQWVKISGTFKAQGGEQFLILGSSKSIENVVLTDILYPDRLTRKQKRNKDNIFMYSYYYIDAVSLWPVDSLGNKIHLYEKEEELDTLHQGESMVLKHIYFNVGESTLLPESYPYLDKIVQTLQEKPNIEIEISGHTDNTGVEKDNMQLSRARAKSVVDYLIKQGIKQDRLSYKGLGSSQPIETNTTEVGRAENRRVEITILPQKNE
ncbi:MAG: OmpA family protein [Bacteroidales bacterium]